jgi:hypothetical protein
MRMVNRVLKLKLLASSISVCCCRHKTILTREARQSPEQRKAIVSTIYHFRIGPCLRRDDLSDPSTRGVRKRPIRLADRPTPRSLCVVLVVLYLLVVIAVIGSIVVTLRGPLHSFRALSVKQNDDRVIVESDEEKDSKFAFREKKLRMPIVVTSQRGKQARKTRLQLRWPPA